MLRSKRGPALATIILATAFALPTWAHQPAADAPPNPAGAVDLPAGPLRIVVTAVSGVVSARTEEGGSWKKVEVGQEFEEGVEIRTGPRSVVKFDIPPSSSITLDRLGVVKVLRATLESGKFVTDLGLKYGRTRFDIDTAGREHEAQIRSPTSVLAIRGTDVILDDTPGFTPRAVSVTGRARYRDAQGNTTSFGSTNATAQTAVDSGAGSAAETGLQQSVQQSPLSAGRTESEQTAVVNIPQSAGLPPSAAPGAGASQIQVLANSGSGSDSLPGGFVPPPPPPPPDADFIQGRLEFVLGWTGDADLQIGVVSPLGEPITTNPAAVLGPPDGATGPINTTSPSGAVASANVTGGPEGTFTESVVWANSFPAGVYRYGVKYNTGAAPANYKLDVVVNGVVLDPTVTDRLLGPSDSEFEGQIFEVGPLPNVPEPTATVQVLSSGSSGKRKKKK